MVDQQALKAIKQARPILTEQQYRTLRGSVLAGEAEGAMKGLRKIIEWNEKGKIAKWKI